MLATLMVNETAASGGDGTTWNTAFDDLQFALTHADTLNNDVDSSNDIDQIWIAEGIYRPTRTTDASVARSATFTLVHGVTLYGGFAGTEMTLDERDPVRHWTTLSGDLGVQGDATDNAYHVVTVDAGITAGLDTLSIVNGSSIGRPESGARHGAGIWTAGHLTLESVLVANNETGFGIGGGVYNTGTLQVANSSFVENSADQGGAIAGGDAVIVNSAFSKNRAIEGSGLYVNGTVTVTNSTIANSDSYDGGQIFGNDANASLTLNNTIVAGNGFTFGEDIQFDNGQISGAHNLIGNGVWEAAVDNGVRQPSLVDGIDGNLIGTLEAPLDPLLTESIQYSNGLWGHGLLSASPALNAGDDSSAIDWDGGALTNDMTGGPRVVGASVDIGATEGVISEPVLSVDDVTIAEDAAGAGGVVFTVSLSEPATTTVTANYETRDGSAVAGSDFTYSSGTITIPAGQSEATITVPVVSDTVFEDDEWFSLSLYNAMGTLNYGVVADVKLLNDDAVLVTTLEDTVDNQDGLISLREALDEFAARQPSTKIQFASELFTSGPRTMVLSGAPLDLRSNTTVYGPGAELLTIDADERSRIFNVNSDNFLPEYGALISGVTLTGGRGSNGSAVASHSSKLTLAQVTVTGNDSTNGAGAIYLGTDGQLTILNSVIAGNSSIPGNSSIHGAYGFTSSGIYAVSGTVSVINSTITGNEVRGIDGFYSIVTLKNSILWEGQTVEQNASLNFHVVNSLTDTDPQFVRAPSDGGDGWGDDESTAHVDESANDDIGDLRLTGLSPAIDAGTTSHLPFDVFDIDSDADLAERSPWDGSGNQRVMG